jgi:hypothetical protein
MVCKRIVTSGGYYQVDENSEELREQIMKNCKLNPEGPAGDFNVENGKCAVKKREQH